MDLNDSLISLVVRKVVLGAAGVFAMICVIDWAVRTRRLNPFGPVARFFRSTVDPVMAPIERRVVRAGGSPSSAPWWALVTIVVVGLVLITAIDFVQAQVFGAMLAVHAGPNGILQLLIAWTFSLLRIAVLVRVIVSWLPIPPYSPWVRWAFVLSEPILRPLRQIVPTIGPLDITPIIAYFVLGLIEGPILRLVA